MKHLLLALLVSCAFMQQAWAQKKSAAGSCIISEIKNIGLYTYDVSTRLQLMRDWLKKNVAHCSEIQLRSINSNRGSWFGHADTLEISTLLDGLYEAKVANKPELMAELFESSGKNYAPTADTTRNPKRPEPVVSPTPFIALPPAGEGAGGAAAMGLITQLPGINPAPPPGK